MTIFFNSPDMSLVAVQYKNVHKIKLTKNCISIYYYDGSFYDLNGVVCPQIQNVRIHYEDSKVATKKMQDFFICLTKNTQAFKF